MSDYLTSLLSRSFGPAESIRPRLPSAFEPSPHVEAETVPSPDTQPSDMARPVAAAAPGVDRPAPAKSAPRRPDAMEKVAPESGAGVDGRRVDAGSQETAALRPVARLETLDMIVPDPAFAEAEESLATAQRLTPVGNAWSAPAPGKEKAAEPGAAPRARARRMSRPGAPEHPDQAAVAASPAISTKPLPHGDRAAAAVRPMKVTREPEPRPEAVRAEPTVAAARARLENMIRPAVADNTQQTAPSPGPSGGELAAAPEILPAPTPLPERRTGAPQADAPTVEVHIGRIEVQAAKASPTPPAREPPGPRRPALSLDDYLRRRSGGPRE